MYNQPIHIFHISNNNNKIVSLKKILVAIKNQIAQALYYCIAWTTKLNTCRWDYCADLACTERRARTPWSWTWDR